jgi:predicted RNA-binding Zn-ribbon protein involved in translation (DUF1610 family)
MPEEKRNFWISSFQRSGQRFFCAACGFAGDFNDFKLDLRESESEVYFICPSCGNELVFDAEKKSMNAGSGVMIHPEVSLGGKGKWTFARSLFLGLAGIGVVLLVLAYVVFVRLVPGLGRLEARLADPPDHSMQAPGPSDEVDFSLPGVQEIGSDYAILPRSAVRESSGVRFRGVLVNERSLAVDAKFRLTMGNRSQTFFVENVAPGTGEPFEVFLPGATDTAGRATIEVLETNPRLE